MDKAMDRNADRNTDRGMDRGADRETRDSNKENRKSVRSKYRTEYAGDHVFDYKDPASLTRFISDGGKITPARISKLSLNQQKKVAAAVKKARSLGLLPNGTDAYDVFNKAELVNPAPFEY